MVFEQTFFEESNRNVGFVNHIGSQIGRLTSDGNAFPSVHRIFDIEERRWRVGCVPRLGAVVNVERFFALILFVMSIDKVECVVHQQGARCLGGPVIHRLILVVRVRCGCVVEMDEVFLAIVPATEAIIAKEGSRFCLNSAW